MGYVLRIEHIGHVIASRSRQVGLGVTRHERRNILHAGVEGNVHRRIACCCKGRKVGLCEFRITCHLDALRADKRIGQGGVGKFSVTGDKISDCHVAVRFPGFKGLGVEDLQVAEIFALDGVNLDLKHPFLVIAVIASPLDGGCSLVLGAACDADTALVIRILRAEGVGAVTVIDKLEQLRVVLGVRPDVNVCAVVGLAEIKVKEVSPAVALLIVQAIIAVACVLECPAGQTGFLLDDVVVRIGVKGQVQSAVHVLQTVCVRRVDHSACLALGGAGVHGACRTRRDRIARAKEEACVRGLVVSGLLCGDLCAVLRVMHQALNPVVRVIGRAVNADGITGGGADNKLLAPVAEEIRRQAGRALGGVAGVEAVRHEEIRDGRLAGFAGQLGDGRGGIGVAVQNFTLQIAVPVGKEIDRRAAAVEGIALHIEHGRTAVFLIAPELCAGVVRPDVITAAAPGVAVGIVVVEEDLFGIGIVKRHAVAGCLFFVADIDLDAGVGRVKVANVHRVAVSLLGGIEHCAVVVNDGRACDDLLLAVAVHIGCHGVVVAVAVGIGAGIGIAGIIRPELFELLVLHGVGGRCQTGVIAASCDNARMHAVQIGDRTPETVNAVAVGIAP